MRYWGVVLLMGAAAGSAASGPADTGAAALPSPAGNSAQTTRRLPERAQGCGVVDAAGSPADVGRYWIFCPAGTWSGRQNGRLAAFR